MAGALGVPCVRSFPYRYPDPEGRGIRELMAKTREETVPKLSGDLAYLKQLFA